MATVLIKGGTIVTASDEYVGDLLMENGKITMIGKNLNVKADVEYDATGKYVLPGGVDQHTHYSFEMGKSAVIGWESSDAAVVSGTTTIVDFVNQKVGWTVKDSVDEYVEKKVSGKACCDYGFHSVVYDPSEKLFEEISMLPEYGMPTMKLFMAYKGHPFHCDDDAILKALKAAKKVGVTIMVHAESADMIDVLQKEALAQGITDPIGHAISRPPIVEVEAVKRAACLAELADAPIYIVHVTAKGAMEAIRDEYARGVSIFGETCTHYLTLTTDKLDQPDFEGAKYVCSPALRSQEHLDALWQAVRKNWLNTISSDHAAFNFAVHKYSGKGNFTMIPNGAAGVENRIPMVWTYGVETGKISRSRFVELCCTNPAKVNGLFPQKGTIAIGSDGDVVIYDPSFKTTVTVADSLHRIDYTAFEGYKQVGRADKVFLRGELVADSGKYTGTVGTGQFISGKAYGLAYQQR